MRLMEDPTCAPWPSAQESTYIATDPADPGLPIGIGDDLQVVLDNLCRAKVHHFRPASRQMESDEQKFQRLASQWQEETLFVSSTTKMCTHPAYLQIIGMGPAAVPLLLRELERQPNHWFWALHAITGADPVDPRDRGNVERMTRAWLRWGTDQG